MKQLRYLLYLVSVVFGCQDIIEVEDISESTVTILAPANEAIISTSSVSFSWESLDQADNYTIQIAMPDFEDALQILTDSTLTQTNFQTTLEPNAYEWRIRAKNSGYETAYTKQGFTIEE